MSGKLDHFNVLIVCALHTELEAAKNVLESKTGSKFVNKYDDKTHLNMLVCQEWNSTPLKVAMTAQREMGGIDCQRHVSELAKYFTANVVVMTGICAGDENIYGNVEHGSVVIARRTTTVLGGKEKSGDDFQSFSQHCDLNRRIVGAINQLVVEGKSSQGSADWVKYVPDDAKRPSPRFVRDHILECVFDNPNILKRALLDAMEDKKLSGMTRMNYSQVLEIMQEQVSPLIQAEGKFKDQFVVTHAGEEYVRTEAGFLRDDVIIGIFESMVTIPNVTENLKEQMKILKKRVADRKLKGVDMESHNFMLQTIDSFAVDEKPGIGVVMKGISDYGSQESKVDYYQVYAASTSAAFLRHLMTEKQSLFMPRKSIQIPSASQFTSGGFGKQETGVAHGKPRVTDVVANVEANVIIQAVVDSSAHLWFEIGQRLGFKAAELNWITVDKGDESEKLCALIAEKQAQLTELVNKQAIEQLLAACKDVNIFDTVMDYLFEG